MRKRGVGFTGSLSQFCAPRMKMKPKNSEAFCGRRGPVATEQHYTALESESNSMACFLSKLLGTRAALPDADAPPGGWGREPVSS
jgi:hypothetical protein